MQRNYSLQRLCTAALLIAVGIVIPMFSPARIILEPASFTLASHVAIFIAMMVSPAVAVAVAIGTTLGFLFSFPVVVVLRAASHIVFAVTGALYLNKKPAALDNRAKIFLFSFLIGVIHAVCEVAVVSIFYFGAGVSEAYYNAGFLRSVLLLVGAGTIVHSMVDFEIALVVFKAISKQPAFSFLKR